ncbi:polysaccharide deacetylase family protein [Actinomyces minihominis]|uniref:polysaccharide deacetylase family protein n=1 Tax=Actinomyces minihominis TaxID=2002838 RepID=UPI000C06CD59|nr:polysaccharide deacetylase family protein [Actinomyces minihominis]
MSARTTRRTNASIIAAGVAATALVLGACTTSTGSQSGELGSANSGKPAAKITLAEYFVHPTDLVVEGLTGQKITNSTGSAARWAYLPGQQPFNDVLAETVGAQLEAQAARHDAVYSPETHEQSQSWLERGCVAGSTALGAREILDDPNLALPAGGDTTLAVVCDTILASGTNYGQKLRFVRGNATEVASDFVEIIYTNTATGEVARGRDLINPAALPALYEAVLDLLKIDPPMSGDQVLAPDAATLGDLGASLSNIGFDGNGDVLVTVDQNFIAFIAAGDPKVEVLPTTLRIPAERAAEMLTPLGAGISASMTEGEAWAGPAPEPSGREFVDCDLVPCVAVTYDDGPSYLTPQVLDVYAERPYAATTFFVLGQNIAGNEEIVKRAFDEGNEIANHSWSHPALTTLDDASVAAQINDTNAAITAVTGAPVPMLRPPYGDLNARTLAAGAMPAILWSVDTNDWQKPSYDTLVNQAVWEATPDGIVLMHDIHEGTVAAAADIADGLLLRGFTLVTVSQLFDYAPLPADFFYSAVDMRG